MQRRAAEESLTDHGKDNSNGRAHVGDAIRHKPGILGFLRQIGFMGATPPLWIAGLPTPDSRRSLRQAAYPQLPEAPTTPTPRPGTRPRWGNNRPVRSGKLSRRWEGRCNKWKGQVSPGAISRHVRQLERFLGTELFLSGKAME